MCVIVCRADRHVERACGMVVFNTTTAEGGCLGLDLIDTAWKLSKKQARAVQPGLKLLARGCGLQGACACALHAAAVSVSTAGRQ